MFKSTNFLIIFLIILSIPISAFSASDEILNTYPKDGEMNVPSDCKVKVFFSGERNASDYEFTFTPSVSGGKSSHENSVIFTPDKPLSKSTLYKVTVKNRTNEFTYSWSFTTVAGLDVTNKSWRSAVKLDDGGEGVCITVDPAGNAYAIWQSSKNICVSSCPQGGNWWKNPVIVCKDVEYGGNPDIVADKSGNTYAVWGGMDKGIYFSSGYKGDGWSSPVRLDSSGGYAYRPHITVDPYGNLFVIFYKEYKDNDGTYFCYKPAGGQWTKPIVISAGGNAYAVFIGDSKLTFSYCLKGGSWAKRVVIDDKANFSKIWMQPDFTVDPSGNVHAIWLNFERGTSYSYGAPGKSWSAPVKLEKDGESIGADLAGNIYLIWYEAYDSKEYLYFSYLQKDGTGTSKEKVSDIPGNGMSLISSAVDSSGNVYVIWSNNSGIYVAVRR